MCTVYCKIKFKLQIESKNKCYILEEKFHNFHKTKYVYKKKYHEDCALLVAPVVALSVHRFYMKSFGFFYSVCFACKENWSLL